ncbi:MAG: FkbM family methyltransferase [Rhizobiales bacterium]|nr:FkbM family methyltransferase [Hyphomicrobiales bacterium]
MQSLIPSLRNHILRHAARILIKSGTFRRHLGTLDPNLDPNFLRAAGLIRNATDEEAVFVRDLVNATNAYAQIWQDLWVLHETRRKRDGYFVEFGATDGIDCSNTYLLERDFNWRGILAEPNPVWHTELMRNRTAKIDLRCVFSGSGERVKFVAAKYPVLGTILGFESGDGHKAARSEHSIIEVETVTLNGLLEQHDAPHDIDYISVDTEGSELEILECFDFSRWNVMLWSVEHNMTQREQGLDRLMREHGYERRYPSCSGIDAWYRRVTS